MLCCVVRFGGVLDYRSIGADWGATGVSSVRETLCHDRGITLKRSPGFGMRAFRSVAIYMLRLTMWIVRQTEHNISLPAYIL